HLLKREKDGNLRLSIVLALKALRADSREVVPAVLAVLEEKGPDFVPHYNALDVLGECGKEAKGAVPTLIGALEHTDPAYRLHAATALAKIDPKQGKEKATPVLVELLSQLIALRLQAAATLISMNPDNRRAWDS